MDIPASTEKSASMAENSPGEGLLDTELPHFPPLPRDSYSPNPIERVSSRISWEPDPKVDHNITHIIRVSWAVVLSALTNSPEVVYGLAFRGRTTDKGDQAVLPFRLLVRPQQTVKEALVAAAARYRQLKTWEHLGLRRLTSDYALTVVCRIEGNDISITALFDSVVLPADQMDMIIQHFSDTLQMILGGTMATLKDLQQIGPRGLQQVSQWNVLDGDKEKSPDPMIHDLIEKQLKSTPKAPAVCAWNGQLTYGELDEWASRLAAQIAGQGVRPGTFVGIYMPKSILAVVGMLAIMKAGGAFVFLPSSLPVFRLRVVCQKTPVQMILSAEGAHRDALQLGPAVQVLEDDDKAYKLGQRMSGTAQDVQPHHPLYAIYTSGSTGEPKGVVVNRGSFGPGSRVFQCVSYAFVVSIIDQLMALAAGACICIPSEGQLQNDMEEAMDRLNATWSTMTSSMARTLDPSKLTSMKTLNLAGEAVNQSDLSHWAPHLTLCGMYGQSESASTLLVGRLKGSGVGEATTGACWIVDTEDPGRLVPIGVEGELMIESTALGSGYLNNPEESAKCFMEAPRWLQALRSQGHKTRCLLTGDIAQYQDSSGTIRIVGRKGTTAKIRGQRVELGEVESQLRLRFPTAKSVIAEVITPAGSGEAQSILVALIGGLPGTVYADGFADVDCNAMLIPTTDDIRSQAREAIANLREVLPSFMIPTTGKIRRKELRERIQKGKVVYRAPQTSEEALLHLSLEDNFFDAGGDSLSVRQLVAKAQLQGAPKLSDLAMRVKETGKSDIPSINGDPFTTLRQDYIKDIPEFLHDSIEDVYPVCELQKAAINAHMIDYFPFHIKGPLNRTQFRNACTTFIQTTPVLRSVTLRSIETPHLLLTIPEDEDAPAFARSWITQDKAKNQGLDLQSYQRPVMKFCLMCKSPTEHVFILRLPHWLYDGGCLDAIGRTLNAAYNADPIPDAPSFADYVRAYGSEMTRLPRASEGRDVSIITPGECSPPPPPRGITMATAVKAAWAWVLHRETRKKDILFGEVASTRGTELPGVKGGTANDIIGFCLNTTAIRVKLDGLETVTDLFDVIHQQHVRGLQHGTIAWSEVIGAANTNSNTSKRKSTDLSFDSVVLHENFGRLPELQLGGTIGHLDNPVFAMARWPEHMLATWPGQGRLTVFLLTREGIFEAEYAESLVQGFCRTLTGFLDRPEASLDYFL
ncbi:putative nonribosomal peptide synthase [Aspergillus undulatus]|uniref:putative nonribosomal peptide synthase n=1 Tax=Aspergillus undulatus TaxID=1810928 RepID=UPI003CCDE929